jgi:hypothetical protein
MYCYVLITQEHSFNITLYTKRSEIPFSPTAFYVVPKTDRPISYLYTIKCVAFTIELIF